MVKFKLNGKDVEFDVPADTPLLWVIREEAKLIGTKFGCGKGICGACTIHFNGIAMRSCITPVSAATGSEITTIEGISDSGDHPVQKAWRNHNVPQCGYCQSGQIMSAVSLLKTNKSPSDNDIDSFMVGNICRCATYNRIKTAIKAASKKLED